MKMRTSVHVRVNPVRNGAPAVTTSGDSVTVTHETSKGGVARPQQNIYKVDRVYSDASSAQDKEQEVFESLGRDVVQSSFAGVHGCVFAYGQTGSGKTHTMIGSDKASDATRGVIPRAADALFDLQREHDGRATLEFSVIEILDGAVVDLYQPPLQTGPRKRRELVQMDDGDFTKLVPKDKSADTDPTWREMSRDTFDDDLKRAFGARAAAATKANATSSRSHAIVRFKVQVFDESDMLKSSARLMFCDLAGSESMSATDGIGKEEKAQKAHARNINSSLHQLTNVLRFLAVRKRSTEQPLWRSSVLTRMFKGVLGGSGVQCKMLVCVGSGAENAKHSIDALEYGGVAMNIKSDAVSRVKMPQLTGTGESLQQRLDQVMALLQAERGRNKCLSEENKAMQEQLQELASVVGSRNTASDAQPLSPVNQSTAPMPTSAPMLLSPGGAEAPPGSSPGRPTVRLSALMSTDKNEEARALMAKMAEAWAEAKARYELGTQQADTKNKAEKVFEEAAFTATSFRLKFEIAKMRGQTHESSASQEGNKHVLIAARKQVDVAKKGLAEAEGAMTRAEKALRDLMQLARAKFPKAELVVSRVNMFDEALGKLASENVMVHQSEVIALARDRLERLKSLQADISAAEASGYTANELALVKARLGAYIEKRCDPEGAKAAFEAKCTHITMKPINVAAVHSKSASLAAAAAAAAAAEAAGQKSQRMYIPSNLPGRRQRTAPQAAPAPSSAEDQGDVSSPSVQHVDPAPTPTLPPLPPPQREEPSPVAAAPAQSRTGGGCGFERTQTTTVSSSAPIPTRVFGLATGPSPAGPATPPASSPVASANTSISSVGSDAALPVNQPRKVPNVGGSRPAQAAAGGPSSSTQSVLGKTKHQLQREFNKRPGKENSRA